MINYKYLLCILLIAVTISGCGSTLKSQFYSPRLHCSKKQTTHHMKSLAILNNAFQKVTRLDISGSNIFEKMAELNEQGFDYALLGNISDFKGSFQTKVIHKESIDSYNRNNIIIRSIFSC